ncbi:putative chitinase [Talaromyces proteolyticus]|uniref:chitinase n=1 Tax=Talaromyces proteolyticus TaxID=1131652 RepID=A0AAD4KLB2_9EURO|nr:putative chitinase [Talaromyces proteolyticus]KAH8690721.1 putative chitinase [Talaromyces proteolyticus]
MHTLSALAGLGLLASSALASPVSLHARNSSSTAQSVVYWGQNGGGTIENNDLAAYCNGTSGIDVLVLGFLYQYGNGNTVPGGGIGQSCTIESGKGQNCDSLAAAIPKCQAKGIKVILSLGGAAGGYSLSSSSEASQIGQYLWDAYGGSGNGTVERPLGNVVVDGFDFDIENPHGAEYYPDLISTLRSNFAKDTSKTYYVTSAPQCPLPEPNMGAIIQNAKFDKIWIQFYNNNNYTYPCALGINGDAAFNWNDWVSFTANSSSKGAELYVGVPASDLGANGTPTGSVYYATPDQLATIVSGIKGDASFGGVMMWSAGFSDANVNNGCTYAQEVSSILKTGKPC